MAPVSKQPRHSPDAIDRLLRYIPLSITIILTLSCILGARRDTLEELLHYTPESLPLAALLLFCAYGVKSLSVVFPISLLYVASGVIFPLWAAWGLNLLGLCLCVTLPYWVGRISGREVAEHICRRHPKAAQATGIATRNGVFTAYLLRVLGILPGDLMSILLGAMGMEYRGYLMGSILGLLPGMLIQTALGGYAHRPASPVFWLLCLLMVAVSAASALAYARYLRRHPEAPPSFSSCERRKRRKKKNGKSP